MASGWPFLASATLISGMGFAIAKMRGLGAILATSAAVNKFAADTPMKQSAPTKAS